MLGSFTFAGLYKDIKKKIPPLSVGGSVSPASKEDPGCPTA